MFNLTELLNHSDDFVALFTLLNCHCFTLQSDDFCIKRYEGPVGALPSITDPEIEG